MAYNSKYTGAEVDALLDKINESAEIIVDTSLSTTSENPVQNKVVTEELGKKVNSSDLATINGLRIDEGGDIEIEGGMSEDEKAELNEKLTELSAETTYKSSLSGVVFGDTERDSVLKKTLRYIWLEILDASFELPNKWKFYLLRNSDAKSPQFMVQLCTYDNESDVIFTTSLSTKLNGLTEVACAGFASHKNKVTLHFGFDFSEFSDNINYAGSFGSYLQTDELNRSAIKENEMLKDVVKRMDGQVQENTSICNYIKENSVVTKIDGINLYNNSNQTQQDIIVGANGIASVTGLYSSQPIFLKKGNYAITHNHNSFGANARYAKVDSNGNFIALLTGVLAANNTILQVDIEDGYYIFNIGNINDISTFMITLDGEYPSEFVPFGSYINNALVRYKDIVDKPDGLTNKIITFNGDSICAGSGGYGKIIAERNNMIYENVAVSGGTITAETYANEIARHWISRTISSMRADADFAIVEGGVNDSSLTVPLGTLSNGYDATLDDTTFYGAFESMLKQLLLRFDGKKVGYIFVHQMTNNFRHLNEKEGSYYWAARMCCEKWGVPFCDLNVSVPAFGLFKKTSEMYVLTEKYTKNADGWHPNDDGYKKYYCDKIEAWLKAL